MTEPTLPELTVDLVRHAGDSAARAKVDLAAALAAAERLDELDGRLERLGSLVHSRPEVSPIDGDVAAAREAARRRLDSRVRRCP